MQFIHSSLNLSSVEHSTISVMLLLRCLSRNDPRLAGVPNGEQPKYFMLNLVYAASVIETPSRITRPGVEIRGAPLKVRSETQYLQAYLSLSAPCTPLSLPAGFVSTLVQHHRRLCYHHGLLTTSKINSDK